MESEQNKGFVSKRYPNYSLVASLLPEKNLVDFQIDFLNGNVCSLMGPVEFFWQFELRHKPSQDISFFAAAYRSLFGHQTSLKIKVCSSKQGNLESIDDLLQPPLQLLGCSVADESIVLQYETLLQWPDHPLQVKAYLNVWICLDEDGVKINQSAQLVYNGSSILNESEISIHVDQFRVEAANLDESLLSGLGLHSGWRILPLSYSSFTPSHPLDSTERSASARFGTAGEMNMLTASEWYGASAVSSPWMLSFVNSAKPNCQYLLGWTSAKRGIGEIAVDKRALRPKLISSLRFGSKQIPIQSATSMRKQEISDTDFTSTQQSDIFVAGKGSLAEFSWEQCSQNNYSRLPSSGRLVGDGLLISFACFKKTDKSVQPVDPLRGIIDRWADIVSQHMNARPLTSKLAMTPTGWCSWYHYYWFVNEEDLLSNLQYLSSAGDHCPVECVQLDDGYQSSIGDWLTVNKKFPSGLSGVAKRIQDAGFMAGLWTAPFLVQRSAQVFKLHPEWTIQENGSPYNWGYHPIWGLTTGQLYCLDPSNPAVLQHLFHVYRTLYSMGFRYFKIDFLNSGLQMVGSRYDSSYSPVESFRTALRVIRQAVTEESFILGCGSPLLPVVGVVDAMRISCDVKESWTDDFAALLASGTGHPSAELALVNCMTRSFLHKRFWLNDPDCLLVRREKSSLTETEIQSLVTILSMTGGMLFLSDNMNSLDAERFSIAQRALPVLGEAAVPVHLYQREKPELFIRRTSSTALSSSNDSFQLPTWNEKEETAEVNNISDQTNVEYLVALMNWSNSHCRDISISPQTLCNGSLPTDVKYWHCFEYWSRRYQLIVTSGDQTPSSDATLFSKQNSDNSVEGKTDTDLNQSILIQSTFGTDGGSKSSLADMQHDNMTSFDNIHLSIKSHGVGLLYLRPAALNHPQVITLTHHIGQGTALLCHENWHANDLTLHVEFRCGVSKSGFLYISIPSGFNVGSTDIASNRHCRSTIGALQERPPLDNHSDTVKSEVQSLSGPVMGLLRLKVEVELTQHPDTTLPPQDRTSVWVKFKTS